MSKELPEEEIITLEDVLGDEADPTDFLFVVNKDGDLKALFMPHESSLQDAPKEIMKILDVFGIVDQAIEAATDKEFEETFISPPSSADDDIDDDDTEPRVIH